jgi:hypothetical protein
VPPALSTRYSTIAPVSMTTRRAPLALNILDHRRLAQRMYPAQFGRREHGRLVPIVAAHLVGQRQFLQQPEDALRA